MMKQEGKAGTGERQPHGEQARAPSGRFANRSSPKKPATERMASPTARRWLVPKAFRSLGMRLARYSPKRTHVLIALPTLLLILLLTTFNLHQNGFVIHARTEAVRILTIKSFPNDGWRIDNAKICEDLPFTATDPEPTPVCLTTLPPEPFFTPADGSSVTIRSLKKGQLEVVIVPVPIAPVEPAEIAPAPDGSGRLSRLRAYAGGSTDITFSGTVRINWTYSTPHSPLVFLGPALIGFAPESGNPGLTLGGTAAGYMAARAGAPRFEVSRADILPGDVLTPEMPGRRSFVRRQFCHFLVGLRFIDSESCEAAGPMHGAILFDSGDDEQGFEIVYAGPAQTIIVDRLGTRFFLAPDWTSRIRNDPLMLIFFGALTLAISIVGLVVGQRRENR